MPSSTDQPNQEPRAALNLDALPPLIQPGQFISQHAGTADFAIRSVSSPNSRRNYESRLRSMAALLGFNDLLAVPWENLRQPHVVALKRHLESRARLKPATVNSYIAVLRAVAKAAFNLKRMSAADLSDIMSVKMVRGTRALAGREVRSEELEKLVRACDADESPAGARDALIVALLYVCGLRRTELRAINVEHWSVSDKTITILGRGARQRVLSPDSGTRNVLKDWLALRGNFEGPLLLGVRKNGKIAYEKGRVSDQAIYRIVKKRASQADVTPCSPHDFRRSMATELLRRDCNLLTVQTLLGHANPQTTQRYDRRDRTSRSSPADSLRFPYEG